MKNYTNLFIGLLIILTATTLRSQDLLFGITANAGLSKVPKITSSPNFDDLEDRFTFSGNGGVFLEKKFDDKYGLGVELLWVQMEALEASEDRALMGSTGEVIGLSNSKLRFHTSYLALPTYLRAEFGDLGIKFGAQLMQFLLSTFNTELEIINSGGQTYSASDSDEVRFDDIDFGPKLGLDFNLKPKIRMRCDYYYGLTNIFINKDGPVGRKNRQINLGLQYLL
ncbi:MAG: porin family protein [Bacteroidota bacterium]